jgi:hypothetical protein
MGLAWSGVTRAAADPEPNRARVNPAAPPGADDFRRAADQFGRTCDAMAALDKELPKDSFDVNAVVELVGRGPDKLFEWVRDQTYWVPYRGALRGATGVLMDRVGNSVDRSLLLGELLRAAGRNARLSHADLTPEQAAALGDKVRKPPAQRLPVPPPARDAFGDETVSKFAAAHQLDAEALKARARQAALEGSRAAEDAVSRVADQAPALLEALRGAGAGGTGAGGAAADKAEVTPVAAALADHWWVQYEDQGRWIDLDPLLPDARPGEVPWKPSATVPLDPRAPGKVPLDAALCHEVEVRVVIERCDPGALREQTVLTKTLRPAELYGQRIVLAHVPTTWPSNEALMRDGDPRAAVKAAALSQHEWLPVLTVGPIQEIQGSFDEAGAVNPKPRLDFLAGTAKAVSGAAARAASVLDALEPAPTAPAKSASVLTAEWVEYEIRAPGRPPEIVRRELFDLLGPAARATGSPPAAAPQMTEARRLQRGLAAVGAVEILPAPCQFSAPFVQHLAIRNMLANRTPVQTFIRDLGVPERRKALSESIEQFTPLSGPLYSLAMLRHDWNPSGNDVYIDRPNILTYRRQLEADARGAVLSREGFDIVANPVAPRPGATADASALRVRQGVADSVAESILMGAVSGIAGRPTESTADAFAEARGRGAAPWVTVRSVEEDGFKRLRLPDDARARLAQDLRAGYVVVAPAEPVVVAGRATSAWWRIDPRSGQVLGMTSQGWGGGPMVEYAHLLLRIALMAYGFYACMDGVAGSTVLKTPEQKEVGMYICIAIAVLAALGMAWGVFKDGMGLTFGGLLGTAGGMAGAAGVYYGRGGTF